MQLHKGFLRLRMKDENKNVELVRLMCCDDGLKKNIDFIKG